MVRAALLRGSSSEDLSTRASLCALLPRRRRRVREPGRPGHARAQGLRRPGRCTVRLTASSEWDALADRVVPVPPSVAREFGLQPTLSCPRRHVGRNARRARGASAARPGVRCQAVWDVGHAIYGGVDPIDVVRAHPERIAYIHLKDVDGDVLERLRREGLGFNDGVRRARLHRARPRLPGRPWPARCPARDRLRRLADGRAGLDLAAAGRERPHQPRVPQRDGALSSRESRVASRRSAVGKSQASHGQVVVSSLPQPATRDPRPVTREFATRDSEHAPTVR